MAASPTRSAEVQNDEKNSTATIFGVPRAIVDYNNGEGAPNFTFPGIDTTTGDAVNNLAAVFNPENQHSGRDQRAVQRGVSARERLADLDQDRRRGARADDGQHPVPTHDSADQPQRYRQRRRDHHHSRSRSR